MGNFIAKKIMIYLLSRGAIREGIQEDQEDEDYKEEEDEDEDEEEEEEEEEGLWVQYLCL